VIKDKTFQDVVPIVATREKANAAEGERLSESVACLHERKKEKGK
jgi:hypothetical protein